MGWPHRTPMKIFFYGLFILDAVHKIRLPHFLLGCQAIDGYGNELCRDFFCDTIQVEGGCGQSVSRLLSINRRLYGNGSIC